MPPSSGPITERFAEEGARLDATYHCPHYPAVGGPCECRKPGTLLYRRAAEEWQLDLASSWGVGDRVSDLEPVAALGGRGLLVRTGAGRKHESAAMAAGFPVVADLSAAVDQILRRSMPAERPLGSEGVSPLLFRGYVVSRRGLCFGWGQQPAGAARSAPG